MADTSTPTPVQVPPIDRPVRDHVLPFRPAILAVRGGGTAVSVALAGPDFAEQRYGVIALCTLIVVYNIFRIIQPVRYVDDTPSVIRVLVEIGIHVGAVVATGYWNSPFVFSLISAVMIAGFARGFAFALRVAIATAAAISIPFLVNDRTSEDIETTLQWTVWLILVALIAGYAKRITGEADRQHTLALDRLGRLADANLLLYSLHRVAQTLPASLDIEEALDTTFGRLRDLFRADGVTVFVLDDTDQTWVVKRSHGPRPAATYTTEALPEPLREALSNRHPVVVDDLHATSPGIAAEMRSGLYAALPARDATVGLVALEHAEERHFRLRDQELLDGFVEPAGLALDNARWFGRLRTVGADEERTRIARDLHDRIGQSLAYLAFELDRIVKVDAKGEPVTAHLGRLRDDVRSVVGEVRDTLYDLRTDVTDSQDVADTLAGFLDRVRERSSLEVKLDAKGNGRIPIMQERELWRIAQEAITNVERHAQAHKVAVTWRCDGHRALLLVVDDGIGFPTGKAGRLDSYGVVGMRERAASIGATLEISGTEGRGTTVRCEVVAPQR